MHRRHADRATDDVRGCLELALHLLEALHDVLARLVEDVACRREPDIAPGALEEPAAPAILQHTDLLADSRLRDEVLRRRGGEALALHHVAEHLQGLQVHFLMSRQRYVSLPHRDRPGVLQPRRTGASPALDLVPRAGICRRAWSSLGRSPWSRGARDRARHRGGARPRRLRRGRTSRGQATASRRIDSPPAMIWRRPLRRWKRLSGTASSPSM